jgi:hypothetical protein
MPKVNSQVCSMALVIYCRLTDNILECTWAERSQAADNYRGESGVCAGLILRAAASTLSTYCDNLGLVRHTEWLSSPLLEKQAQADILRLYKKLLRELPFPVTCTYVKSHQDSGGCSYFDLSLEEKLNCRCDALAKDALVNTVAESTYIKSDFPFEDVRVHLNCEKLITSARRSFHDHHSYEQAKMAFDRKGLVDFDDCLGFFNNFRESFAPGSQNMYPNAVESTDFCRNGTKQSKTSVPVASDLMKLYSISPSALIQVVPNFSTRMWMNFVSGALNMTHHPS